VTLAGGNFPTLPTVTFGQGSDALASTDVRYQSPAIISAVAPPHSVGSVDVTVANGTVESVTLHNAFTYVNPPAVAGITPTSGSSVGGTQVTITGSEFQDGATVKFGALAAEVQTVVSATTITVTTPSQHFGTVDVTVTNPDGQSATLPKAFTYIEQGKVGCKCGGGDASSVLALGIASLALLRRRRRAR
jgi:uncharacterized protein (TIGR03382 family)